MSTPNPDKVFTISEITALIKDVLESSFDAVWVEGEISNYKLAASGHRYFSLKDESATLRCTLWRGVGTRLQFEPKDGQRVRAFGSLSVYPPQGSYQLSVAQLVDAGIGPLEIAFQKLKEKLQKEGLFDADRKRPIPALPGTVGVVTSPTGAAFVDITRTIHQRAPFVRIILAPVRVQGEGAREEITAAIRRFNARDDIDVLVVGRGGGSLEDLWPFNEEIVARAIVESRIPIISAVGHEVDFTIADFAADFRAPTPTGAAERVTDGWVRVRHELPVLANRLKRGILGRLTWYRHTWQAMQSSHALRRPGDLVRLWAQRLDETAERLGRASVKQRSDLRHRLDALSGRLQALSPEAVLQRGYSITRLLGSEHPLRSTKGLAKGQKIETTLASGQVTSEITDTTPTS